MSPTGKGKHNIKVSTDIELYKLIKKIAGVSDTSMNAAEKDKRSLSVLIEVLVLEALETREQSKS